MKNLFTTTLFLALALGSFAQYGQLPNGGFENWSNDTLYDYPTDWNNANVENFQGIPTVFQSTDAQDGTYSCELTAELAGQQDTVFGYVMHGYTGPTGPSAGIAYNINFNEMQYYYKCDLAVGDTLFVIATRFIAGVPVTTAVVEAATGTASTWTAGTVSFPNGAQDELFIGFVLGNPFGTSTPSPGSWARVDNVTMHNAGIPVTNVPDPSFENWSSVSTEDPDDWYTLNPILSALAAENAVKTTDANTGTYAIEMTTIQPVPGGDTIQSFLSNGAIDLFSSNPFQAAPYNANPTALTGAYKYAPSSLDQGFIQLTFLENGTPIGFETQAFNSAASWQTFNLPITIVGTPDSMSLIAFSGDNQGSVLHLDDLAFSGGNVSLDEFSSMNVDIYPNPATTSVMIKAEGSYTYSIVNLSGQEVVSQNDANGAIELDISALSSGAYFVEISNEYNTESHKLIVE
ncbi:MAG: T9SS type A sorting domain-containing protein [Crocinitomicaceae bacterium]|nr:T9SS type A sorting domain-containing protein [Crocinitomicaceae bacterium]